MCLAIPARIESIEGQMAQVDMNGVRYTTSLALTPQAEVGQYVIVHAGFALNVLDEAEAQETLRIFEEMAALEAASSRPVALDAGSSVDASPSPEVVQ